MSRRIEGWPWGFKVLVVALLTALVTSTAFLAGFASASFLAPTPTPSQAAVETTGTEEKAFHVFWEAWHILERDFCGELPDPQEMTRAAIRGVLATLDDEYTVLIEPQMADIFKEDLSGAFEGIGAAVKMRDDGRLVIVQPFEGQPAAQAGLKPGDIILAVDGQDIQGMNVFEAIALIRGPEGTAVRLLIERDGKSFEVQIVRRKIEIPVVESRMLEDNIAYVKLLEFNASAGQKLKVALRDLMAQKPKGLILDLRNNPGGLLDVAIDVASQFISRGPILVERFKSGAEQEYLPKGGGLALDVPLVVLVNGASASASEIVAGAIQDSGRGTLIGERTFGKGSVQLSETLSDGSELRVTTAHWFTPKGRAIQGEGLVPDIVVEVTDEDLAAGRDPQLERAIEYLMIRDSRVKSGK